MIPQGGETWLPAGVHHAISHMSPCSDHTNRTWPFRCVPIMLSMTRVPKPWCVGGLTEGPCVSVQLKATRPFCACDHSTRTQPSETDKAPYLAALVANSCSVTAIACAVSGSNS